MGFLMSTRPCGCYTESQNIVFNRDGSFTALPGTATLLVDHCAAHSGLPFTDAELERFQETLRQGGISSGTFVPTSKGWTFAAGAPVAKQPVHPPCNLPVCDHSGGASRDCATMQACDQCMNPTQKGQHTCGQISAEEIDFLIDVFNSKSSRGEAISLCTAKPSCGNPDEECPVCKAGNCPGVKCWRGCEVKR